VWRTTLKGLLAHKLRLFMTALAIVLGVGFVAGTYILTDTMNRAFDDLFGQIDKGVAVEVSGIQQFKGTGPGGQDAGPAERVPNSVLAQIERVPGVRVAEGSLTGYAQLVDKSGKAITTGGAPTLGVSSIADPQLSAVTVRQGRRPERSGEIGVDAKTASGHDLHVGDQVTVLLEGPPIQGTIVGIFGFGSADNLGGATLVAFDPQTAQVALRGGGKWDTIEVAAKPGVSPSDLRDRIQRTLPPGFQAKTGTQAAQDSADQIKKGLSFFNIALLVFAGVAIFVGAFTIFNTFSILIAQRTRELALLRAIGASPRQVRRSVLGEAAIVGLVASAIGLGFGFLIALGLQGLLRGFGISLPTTSTQLLPRTVIAALVVGLLTTLASSVVPAIRASRVPPIAALREAQPVEYRFSRRRTAVGLVVTVAGIGFLFAGLFGNHGASAVGLGAALVFLGIAGLSPLVARPFARLLGAPFAQSGVSGKLGRENAMRNPRRTASTAAALMIGLGLVAFVSIFASSVKASANSALEQVLRADYAVIPSSLSSQGFSLEVADRLRAEPAFSTVEEFRQGVFGVNGSAQQMIGTDPSMLPQVENVKMQAGSLAGLHDGDVLVYKTVAEDHHWRLGQIITAQFARTGKQPLRIVGIFGDNRGLANYVVTLGTFERNFTQQLDASILLKAAPGVSGAQARAAAARVTTAFPNVKVEDQEQLRKTTASQINQVLGLITALLALSILIAFFGVANTLGLSILERTRELGLLRAVGMGRRQVRSMVRWESVIISLFGAILGIAVGVFFGWAMVQALKSTGINVLSVPALQLLLYLLIAAIFGVFAATGPARRAARLNILRAIAEE